MEEIEVTLKVSVAPWRKKIRREVSKRFCLSPPVESDVALTYRGPADEIERLNLFFDGIILGVNL